MCRHERRSKEQQYKADRGGHQLLDLAPGSEDYATTAEKTLRNLGKSSKLQQGPYGSRKRAAVELGALLREAERLKVTGCCRLYIVHFRCGV